MPSRPQDRVRQQRTAGYLFTDRTSESEALAQSLAAMDARLNVQDFDTSALKNVLVFYGFGGVGKSQLSEQLERWVTRRPAEAQDWGSPPLAQPVRTARWDLKEHGAAADHAAQLIALRAGIATRKQRWPAFTIALAAYLVAVRPGEQVALTTSIDVTGDVVDVLSGIASELGATDIVTSFSAAAIGRVVKLASSKLHESKMLRHYPLLGSIFEACQRASRGANNVDIASDILWLLMQEIANTEPAQRPRVAVFIDHFEAVENENGQRAQEALNQLIGNAPYFLFVVTGRNRLSWDIPTTKLTFSGPQEWPLLQPHVTEEPHQHLLDRLSESDSEKLFKRRRDHGRWPMGDQLLSELVEETAGWPLHIDAVCQLASNRTGEHANDPTFTLTAADLAGDLHEVVIRLFEDLAPDESLVFQAACLLPFFDADLVRAVSGTTDGAVQRCLGRAIIDDNPSSDYDYRVHDELRRLVREAGPRIPGGWSPHDWREAAERGLAEAERRHARALELTTEADRLGREPNYRAQVDALILGLTIGVQEQVYADWLLQALKTSPTVSGLARSLPVPDAEQSVQDAGSIVRHIHDLTLPTTERLEALKAAHKQPTPIASRAGLWRAYGLRSAGRFVESLEMFAELQTQPNLSTYNSTLYHHGTCITLRSWRKFEDALEYREQYAPEHDATFERNVWQSHGIFDPNDNHQLDERINKQTSARFRLELETTRLRFRACQGEIDIFEAQELRVRATELAANVRQIAALRVLGYASLHDPSRFAGVLADIRSLRRQPQEPAATPSELLALRALLTRQQDDIDLAVESAKGAKATRSSLWIPVEVFLEELGHPMPPGPEAQWLVPYQQVRANWLGVAERIHRASAALT